MKSRHHSAASSVIVKRSFMNVMLTFKDIHACFAGVIQLKIKSHVLQKSFSTHLPKAE